LVIESNAYQKAKHEASKKLSSEEKFAEKFKKIEQKKKSKKQDMVNPAAAKAPKGNQEAPETTEAETQDPPTRVMATKPSKGKVFKHVLEAKKTLRALDGHGDWDVVEKRAKTMIEKNIDTSDDETDSDY